MYIVQQKLYHMYKSLLFNKSQEILDKFTFWHISRQ